MKFSIPTDFVDGLYDNFNCELEDGEFTGKERKELRATLKVFESIMHNQSDAEFAEVELGKVSERLLREYVDFHDKEFGTDPDYVETIAALRAVLETATK